MGICTCTMHKLYFSPITKKLLKKKKIVKEKKKDIVNGRVLHTNEAEGYEGKLRALPSARGWKW